MINCLFKNESSMFGAEELVKMSTITCEYDKCTRPVNFYNCAWKYVSYECYVKPYCETRCNVCKTLHKCRDDDCVETLVKAKQNVLRINRYEVTINPSDLCFICVAMCRQV